jgi:hypothetical protein
MEVNKDLVKYNKISGVLKRYYNIQMSKMVQLAFINVVSKTSFVYGSEL